MQVLDAVRASGMVGPRARVLALLSGGADSTCLVHALLQIVGADRLHSLHVNHGLREAAAEDERFCTELCNRIGVDLTIERVRVSERGNLEAAARDARYAAAEQVRQRLGLDLVATGHTATDQVETVLFRLASSPGRRALLGMPQKSGALVRPLLDVSSQLTRAYCSEHGLAWREDETNEDLELARNRIRLEVLPALRAVHPAMERNVLSTVEQLGEESQVLEVALDEAADLAAAGGHPPAVAASRLRELPVAVRRLMLRRLAEQAAGGPLPLDSRRVEEIERLAARGGSGSLDLGAGVSVVAEYGLLRFERSPVEQEPEPALLPVPGRCRFGDWSVLCVLEEGDGLRAAELGSLDEPLLDAAKLGEELTVRGWRDGDAMRPLGLGGTKSLQDLFTDRKVPRSLRSRLPVVESGGEIAWVAGVALSERFRLTDGTGKAVRLRASAAGRSDMED